MLRLASDDVHGEIIRGLRRRLPEIDLVRAQDVLPEGTPDPEVLALWANSRSLWAVAASHRNSPPSAEPVSAHLSSAPKAIESMRSRCPSAI